MRVLIICILAFLLLLILISIFPSTGLPSPYEKRKVEKLLESSFSTRDCYGETESTERAALVDSSSQALSWRLNLIRSAKKEICYTTFDFRADRSGTDVISAFYDAAERGVKVRVLIDGINGFLRLAGNQKIRALAMCPNVEVREYNPAGPLTLWKMQFRMHDKYLIVDNMAYLLGGRNTNDLFLGDFSRLLNTDRELLVYETVPLEDSSLAKLKRYFESVWNLPVSRPSYRWKPPASAGAELQQNWQSLCAGHPGILKSVDWKAKTLPVNRITILANPADVSHKKPVLWYQLVHLMQAGKNPIVETPYLICNRTMYQDISNVKKQAGSLKIITNSMESGANFVGCADYAVQRRKAWRTGAEVYELVSAHSSHTKTVLVDDRLSVVGTFNFDMRSTYLDTELMLAVDSAALASQLRQTAEKELEHCKTTVKGRTIWRGPACPEIRLSCGRHFLYCLVGILHIPIRHLL